MLFAKKKNLRFDEMEHIESPNLSELEATLDFLKKTPEKKEDDSAVLHPMPAIEPPKIDADKNTAVAGEDKAAASSSAEQDIAFEDDASAGTADGDAPVVDISEEIIKKAEALREKQLLNDSVNTEAELALKKDETNVTKNADEAADVPQKEVSDAVKAAMALQAEYEAKKKETPIDPRRSRFMKRPSSPVKKETEQADEQRENVEDETKESSVPANDETGKSDKPAEKAGEAVVNDADKADYGSESAESEEIVAAEEKTKDSETAEPEDSDKAESNDKEEVSEELKETEEAGSKDIEETSAPTIDDKTAENTEVLIDRTDSIKNEGTVNENEKTEEKASVPRRKASSTAITSNLKLPNDVIVSNIESSARSMGKYAGAAKIANPLPHPKKHITRNMDFDYPVSAAQMHFDIEDLNGMDFFDIDD